MASARNIEMVIQRMLQKLVAEYAPQKVVLFGSYAYETPGPDSDIDLLIIKETLERFLSAAGGTLITGNSPPFGPQDAKPQGWWFHPQTERNSTLFLRSSADRVATSLSSRRICSPTEYRYCWVRIIPA